MSQKTCKNEWFFYYVSKVRDESVTYFSRYSYFLVTLISAVTSLLENVTSYCNAVTCNALL